MADNAFWESADTMIQDRTIVVDRPAGSVHPRNSSVVYPMDYGYLDGTSAVDGEGIDCWRGSLTDLTVTGVIVTVDLWKHDSELKWLIACTHDEAQQAVSTHRTGAQTAMLILRHPDKS